MPILSEAIKKAPIRLFVYGPTGCGKTTLWGMMTHYPDIFCPIRVIDFDLRLGSLAATLDSLDMGYIDFDEFRDTNIQGDAFMRAETELRTLEIKKGKGELKFKTVVLDSTTFMNKHIMNRVLVEDGGKPSNSIPQIQHYLRQQSYLEDFVAKTVGLGLNIVFTAHEDKDKDELTGRLFKNVDLTGKSANRIPGYFNEFWHCENRISVKGDTEYTVRVRSDSIYAARTSYKILSTIERQEEIWGKIVAEIERARELSQQATPLQALQDHDRAVAGS